ncbi:hypothetical protein EG68_00651 [Paragonimus skrjabini miyazakii]|uniref:Uncharacterized protein n=1 Tax=Paragonimus skrjabini miyazakii TaxID=59628 RepID=A0A8S9ZC80_9TREM|nr:hypothetical protein EG68_00651 [Paragonimus skrjabini miyazakii]
MLSPLQWEIVSESNSPHLQDHAGALIGDFLYIHGGLNSCRTSNRTPSNGLYKIQVSPKVGTWCNLTSTDSPVLSQHACLGVFERYLVFIGGWNGQTRVPYIYTYDTESNKWLPAAVAEPLLKGFPSGAGLSAHTSTLMKLDQSKNSFSALIVGREGSLRTQRKSGNIYLLYGILSSEVDTAARYTYVEGDSKLSASSRSYHTSTTLSPNVLVNIGGRRDRIVELLSWSRTKVCRESSWPATLHYPPARCAAVTNLLREVRQNHIATTKLSTTQSGWRGHAAIPGDGGIFISSGEGFNALVRDPLDSAFVLNCRDGQTDGVLYNVGKLTHPRAYGVSCVHATDGTAWFHGGIGLGGKTQNSLLRLKQLEPTEESESK